MALMLSLLSQPLWADVNASLTENTIYDGDTVTLVIETNDRSHDGEPDLSVLQEDFEVLGTRTSQQTQIINGRRTDKRQWHVELAPKNSGTVTVPAISVGSDTTEPLQLSVTPRPAAVAAGSGQPVFIKAEIEPADGDVYVQQQIHYSLKLYYREQLTEGSFDDLVIEHALIERLGDDSSYTSTVNGERYQVLERHYAIFPEQSGELIIPAAMFNGRMAGEPLQRSRRNGAGSMVERFFGSNRLRASGKRVRLRSDGFTLNIKPRPAAYSGAYWLPGEQLALEDSWAEGPPEFRTGEPVTRTITLEVKGLESSHLPEISLPDTDGVRLYPEKPEHETRTDGEWVYGSSKQSVAYVPVATGRITLPEIRIDWWDTTAQQQRSAVIPAWEINVLAGEAGPVEALPPPVDATEPANIPDEAEVAADEPGAESASPMTTLLAVIILALLIITGIAWRRLSGRSGAVAKDPPVAAVKEQLAEGRDALEKACTGNDPHAAARALLQWAGARWPDAPPRNLGALAQRLANGQHEIRNLERALYAADADAWQGNALWQLFNNGFEVIPEEQPASQEGLSPLYPDWKAR